ncbi:MAG: hypothetical protein WCK05_12125, partial [Planctomycetota bacterium]
EALKRFAFAVKSIAPTAAQRLIESWPSEQAAAVLHVTAPELLDAADWFFSAARDLAPDWCRAVGHHLDSRQLVARAQLSAPGNIHPIADIIQIVNRVGAPILRSAVRSLIQTMARLVSSASLDDLYFPWAIPGLILLSLYPNDVKSAFGAVDAVGLAQAYEVSLPRYWRRLADLSLFARSCGSDLPRRFADAVQPDVIAATALRFAEAYPHETAQILYQLSDASDANRRIFAKKLLPAVASAYLASKPYREQVLVGFYTLCREEFPVFCGQIGIPVPEVQPLDESLFPSFQLLHPNAARIEAQIAKLESAGADYDVASVLRSQE